MDLTSDGIPSRRKFLALLGAAVATVSILAYLLLGDIRDGVSQDGSSDGTGARSSKRSDDTDGDDEPVGPSVEIQVSRDVATVVVERPGWAEVFVIEWFDVTPSEAETAVGDGYTGEKVSEIPAGEGESERFVDLSTGTYVVVAETQSRRKSVGSFQIESA